MGKINLPEYLLNHFDKIAKQEGFLSYTLKQENGSTNGDGFLAAILSVTISGKQQQQVGDQQLIVDGKLKLICKLLPKSEANQKQFESYSIFKQEVFTYNNILRELNEYQLKLGLNETNGFFAYPMCYAATCSPDSNDTVIIMKDLRTEGYEMWNKSKSIEAENVNLLMIQLGRLHGVSFALRDQKPDIWKLFQPINNFNLRDAKGIQDMMNHNFKKSIKLFKDKSNLMKLQKISNNWFKWLHECCANNVNEPFTVVTHGDCWNNNMMFAANCDDINKKICLLDWQATRIATPAVDLSYYIFTSTDKKLRSTHLSSFLQLYYDTVAATIRACGSDPDKLFTFDNLTEQLRKYAKFGVFMAPILTEIMVASSEMVQDMDDYAEQIANGMESVELCQFDAKTERVFVERLNDTIDDAMEYGWI